MLPVILAAVECPTHSIVDAALRSLPVVLPVLDFSTIKNELFPVIATVFSKTNSLAIKVRGLRAFVILCGGSNGEDDGLNGASKTSSSSALDKYTMQEKIVPLIKAIKTKEPAVMLAALDVLRIVGGAADADFVAMDLLPILWSMSLGPLLNLKQFQSFMELIKSLSRRVEDEQTRKLQELGGTTTTPNEDFMAFGGVTGTTFEPTSENDFEALVKGRPSTTTTTTTTSAPEEKPSTPQPPTFAWSTPPPTNNPTKPPQKSFRTVTPDLGRFEAMTPSSTQYSKPLQPQPSTFSPPPQSTFSAPTQSTFTPPPPSTFTQPVQPTQPTAGAVNWSAAKNTLSAPMSSLSMNTMTPMQPSRSPSFTLPPPPGNAAPALSPQPWGAPSSSGQSMGSGQTGQKSGLDKYESLI